MSFVSHALSSETLARGLSLVRAPDMSFQSDPSPEEMEEELQRLLDAQLLKKTFLNPKQFVFSVDWFFDLFFRHTLLCGAGLFCETTPSIRGFFQSQTRNLGHPREILREEWCTPRASRCKHRVNGGRWLASLVCSKGGVSKTKIQVMEKILHHLSHLRSLKLRSWYSGWLCFLSRGGTD